MAITCSLEEISKIGGWKGPSIEEPGPDLLMEMVSTGSSEQVENKRYYVSDTELIERRFLKDATETFDRDTDPFANAILYKSALECVNALLGIDTVYSELSSQKFLDHGSTGVYFQEILTKLAENYSTQRIAKKFRSVDDGFAEKTRILAIANVTYSPIVIEDLVGGKTWDSSWVSPPEGTPKIVWVRRVVDGYLGVIGTQRELEELGVWKKVCKDREDTGSKITVRRKVSEIREELKKMDITYSGVTKKNELVNIYRKHVIFPEQFLSTIA
jgi:hypothetical protein